MLSDIELTSLELNKFISESLQYTPGFPERVGLRVDLSNWDSSREGSMLLLDLMKETQPHISYDYLEDKLWLLSIELDPYQVEYFTAEELPRVIAIAFAYWVKSKDQ